ncbi:MAG: hypothetical protein F4Z04_07700 [Acidobacteria bacterium]|nr:hypothetical protein [Acidobacteriota bacterium]
MGTISPSASTVSERIMNALEDPRWDWRTVEGINRDTGIPADEIWGFLSRSGDRVVRSVARDRLGRVLFTSRQRYRENHSPMERLLDHYRSTYS